MSTHNMFSWRNKKNIMWILPLICSYVGVLSSLMRQRRQAGLATIDQNSKTFLFQVAHETVKIGALFHITRSQGCAAREILRCVIAMVTAIWLRILPQSLPVKVLRVVSYNSQASACFIYSALWIDSYIFLITLVLMMVILLLIFIAQDKALFQVKSTNIFLISPGKHMLWYLLEVPLRTH